MGVKEICKPWEDVFEVAFDEYLAPELGDLLSGKKNIYTEPYEFFSRTYLTSSILESLENIVDVVAGRGGNNVFTIYSLFGGGKTHSLYAIYHAIKKPEILAHEDVLKGYDEVKKNKIRQIAESIKKIGDIQVVVIYGKDYAFCGKPSAPIEATGYKIRTVWGYFAYSLGRYDYLRKDDENLTLPDITTLRKVIEDKPVVVLIDEIVDYAYGLKGSQVPAEKEYVDTVPQFLDRLSSAVVGTKTAVVVTLPIEAKGESIEKTESWYEKEFVRKYWTALHRAGAKDLPALKIGTGEIIDVIKRRNFKNIEEQKAEVVIKDFERMYKQHKDEVFGRFEDTINKMKRTYPYHPELVEILMDIVEKAGLQKTRDMLKLTRKIIRNVWESSSDPYAIMPWHLDVRLDLFHGDLFRSGVLADYSTVVRRDIVEHAEKFDVPELARKIATVIFLKTYIYDSPTPQIHFPTAFDISKMVYEQEFFTKNKLAPPYIIDTLEQMESKAYMHHLQAKDGRYWFWKIASVKEQIQSEARRLIEEEKNAVENKVAEKVEKLVRGEGLVRGKRKREEIKVLNEKETYVIRELDKEFEDTPGYKTVFLVNANASLEDCERIMFKYRGSERTYKNTIICVYPNSSANYQKCVEQAAILLACEKIKNELPQLYPEAGEEIINIQKTIINKLKESAEEELTKWIFVTFSKIAYPSVERDRTKPKAGVIDAIQGGSSTLLGQTFLALASPQLAKILEEFSFDSLKREIKEVLGIDITKTAGKKVADIKNWFKTNPAFPMVEDKSIEEAIKEGVRKLEIGIKDDKIWYKKIHENEVSEEIEEGERNIIIKDDYRILPWKEAIEKQVNSIVEESNKVKEEVEIEYLVKYEGSTFPLKSLLRERDWEEIVRAGFIIKKARKKVLPIKDFGIKLNPGSIKGKPGKKVEVKVKVEPREGGDIFVKLKPELGEVVPSEGMLPLECVWKLEIPAERGMRSIEIKVESEEQTKSELLVLTIESDTFSTTELTEEHIGMKLFEVRNIRDIELLKELNGLSERIVVFGEAKIAERDKEIKLYIKNVEGEVVEYAISQIKEVVEGVSEVNLNVYFKKEVEIDELVFHKIKQYNEKAEFKLKR